MERGIWHWCRVSPCPFFIESPARSPRRPAVLPAAGPACADDPRRRPAMTSRLEHGFAELGDVTIHYVTAGQGPPIVLIQGSPQTWFMWRDIIAGLACHYRVVAPDLRGLGESSRPVAGYDKKTMSNDIWLRQ